MKILLVADLHYALPQFDWVVKVAADYDLVVVAGDMLDISSAVEPEAQIVVVLAYLRRIREKTRLIVCSGNHDLDIIGGNGERKAGWLRALRRFGVPVDGETIQIEDVDFTLCAWWDGPRTVSEIEAQLRAAGEGRSSKWFWVYHAPPANSPVAWSGQRSYGDAQLLGWIAEHGPQMVMSGHVHDAPFARDGSWVDQMGATWLFNPGKQIGPVPTSIAIDTGVGEAAWFSLEGAESVRLDAPLTRPVEPLQAMPAWMAPRL